MKHLAEQYANEYLKDFDFNDPASESDLRIIVQHAFQAGRDSKVKKLQAMRYDDFKLIQSLQKQLDEALQTIEELRLKLSEFIVED